MKGIQTMTLKEKIKAKTLVDENGCWVAQDTPLKSGYVHIRHKSAKKILGHRASYQEFKGPIPDGMLVLHDCDNRKCWNPEHLFTGTHGDNTKDAVAKGKQRNLFKPGPEHPRWNPNK